MYCVDGAAPRGRVGTAGPRCRGYQTRGICGFGTFITSLAGGRGRGAPHARRRLSRDKCFWRRGRVGLAADRTRLEVMKLCSPNRGAFRRCIVTVWLPVRFSSRSSSRSRRVPGTQLRRRVQAPRPPQPRPRQGSARYLLERVDDAAVVQLYADGFKDLALNDKILIWHLYQAAIAGRDIYVDQKHEHALEMRHLLEQIITHANGIDAATLAEIQRYTKLFWINNGPYNNLTARKFVLKSTPQAFAAAAKAAVASGAAFTLPAGESLDATLARLQPMFFDPAVDPIVTNKTPGPGKDLLAESANNLYDGVTVADLKGFVEKNGLNSRLVKRERKAGRRDLQDRWSLWRADQRGGQTPRGGNSICQ